jgi:predicted short-subunit dehydrogenase-like oxidoreductase (DUF2520 family)
MIESVSIIGAGNVASAIAGKLFQEGIKIIEIHSKSDSAQELASSCNALVCRDISQLKQVDLVLICVNDSSIEEVNLEIDKNLCRAHTSGSINITSQSQIKSGVFYPLQTFSKNKSIDWSTVPIVVQSETKEFAKELASFASIFSDNVVEINAEQRAVLHLAAVFACNFSNHMYAIADTILQQNQLSFDLLKPLIRETATKAVESVPAEVQTGPAQREDFNVIAKHLNHLEAHPPLKELYKSISQSIINLKHGKKL